MDMTTHTNETTRRYLVRPLSDREIETWDSFVAASGSGTLFSLLEYVRHLDGFRILGAFSGDRLVAGFPVPVIERDGAERVERTSYLSPYFIPVFAPIEGRRVYRDRIRRAILTALIEYIQSRFGSFILPLHPLIDDMTPFQRAHCNLELRYTYTLALDSLERIREEMSSSVRNHIARSRSIDVIIDRELRLFDFARALVYEPDDHIPPWKHLVRTLVASGRGTPFVALADGAPVGGLFLAHDHHTAYDLLSYFDRDSGLRGLPSALIWSAIEHAATLGLGTFDFEGSVLPAIETFFQSFGGERRPYFQAHWHADPERFEPILYHYQ